jgi:hypothetical protein
MAARKKTTEAKPKVETGPTYEDGFRECAEIVREHLKGLWTKRTSEMSPTKLFDFLASTLDSAPVPKPADPDPGARIEGEDVV